MMYQFKRKVGKAIVKICSIISPKLGSKMLIKLKLKRKLDLTNPKLFNDKIQWLKLYGDVEFMTKCADKYAVRDYLKEIGYENILTNVYGVYEKSKDIDYSKLPNKFALKCNHGCGCNVIVSNKETLNVREVNKKLNKFMKTDYSKIFAEIQYKNIKPLIMIEEFIETDNGLAPNDYKFYSFNGDVECVMVCVGREDGHGKAKYYFFDKNWKILRINPAGKNAPIGFTIPKPPKMDEMWKIASDLSKGIPFVRVDLYCEKNKIYFGELTFTPSAGADENLKDVEELWGEKIILPKEREKYEDNRISNK